MKKLNPDSEPFYPIYDFANLNKIKDVTELKLDFKNEDYDLEHLFEKIGKYIFLKKIQFHLPDWCNIICARPLLFDEKNLLKLIQFLDQNNNSLQSICLQYIETDLNWEMVSKLFKTFSKMKKLITFNLKIYGINIEGKNILPKLSKKLRKMFKNNNYLINFDLMCAFDFRILNKLNDQYNFFIRKRNILINQIAALKKNKKIKCFRREIFLETFLNFLEKKEPQDKTLKKIVFEIPFDYFDHNSNHESDYDFDNFDNFDDDDNQTVYTYYSRNEDLSFSYLD